MHYTIAVLEDLAQDTKVLFNACGNKYTINIINGSDVTTQTYLTHEDAVKVFLLLAKAVATGCYSYKQRVAML